MAALEGLDPAIPDVHTWIWHTPKPPTYLVELFFCGLPSKITWNSGTEQRAPNLWPEHLGANNSSSLAFLALWPQWSSLNWGRECTGHLVVKKSQWESRRGSVLWTVKCRPRGLDSWSYWPVALNCSAVPSIPGPFMPPCLCMRRFLCWVCFLDTSPHPTQSSWPTCSIPASIKLCWNVLELLPLTAFKVLTSAVSLYLTSQFLLQ